MPGPTSNAEQRCEAFYSGRVQGVGFRYTVRHLAGGFRVAGFVRNLPDGRVQMMAEGPAEDVSQFLAAIAEEMASHIRSVSVDFRPATGEFLSFEIRH